VWAPEPIWMQWQREKTPAPAGNQTPVMQPITILTELPDSSVAEI